MAGNKSGYVSDKLFRINMLDLVTLLGNVHKGAGREDVGFEDANNSIEELTKRLAKFQVARLTQQELESTLWSANLMDEVGSFWSPRGESFEEFLRRLLRDCGHEVRFNRDYNWIESK